MICEICGREVGLFDPLDYNFCFVTDLIVCRSCQVALEDADLEIPVRGRVK